MNNILIVTDTVANIPLDLCKSLGIVLVPLHIEIGGKSYRDTIDIDANSIYQQMRKGGALPLTSQPNPYDYLLTLENNLTPEIKTVLIITLSSKLSSTYLSALSAKQHFEEKHPQIKIVVIDSLLAAMNQGWAVIEAARKAIKGANLDEVIQRIKDVSRIVKLYAVFETLEYLRRGGRISAAVAFLGSAFHILPIITLSPEGMVVAAARVRSKKNGLEWMKNRIKETFKPHKKLHIAVMHADAHDEAGQLKKEIEDEFPCSESFIATFTPVMGVHTGPGIIGVSFFTE